MRLYLGVVTRHRANVRRLRISSFPTGLWSGGGVGGWWVTGRRGSAGLLCTQFEDEFGGAVQYSCVATVGTRRGGSSDSLPTLGAVNFNPGTHVVRIHPVNTTVTITTAALVSLLR